MRKILVIGQTPPPYNGQAMMIERLVNAQYDDLKIYHVRMNFSSSIKSIGKFKLGKVWHMFSIIWKAIYLKFKYRINTLYYPPAGPNLNPILRDLIILFCVRPFFKNTIYHFRAAGISEYLEAEGKLIKVFAKIVYQSPKISIQLSTLNPADGKYFDSKKILIIKNGLEDAAFDYLPIQKSPKEIPNILYVGSLQESKGIRVMMEAATLLKKQSANFHVSIIGSFASNQFEKEIKAYCQDRELDEYVSFLGVKIGKEKWDYYNQADIFCFPSFFECESFGNVVVEAMMFEIPVVATKWRGIPDIVKDGETGFLVPIKNSIILSTKLLMLINDFNLRRKFGVAGRKKFLEEYLVENHLNTMRKMFFELP